MGGELLLHEKLFVIDQIPLFKDLSAKDKKELANASVIEEHKKGDIVYREGAPPDAFYCVITGRLKAYITKNGREEDLEYLKRGKYFGIISILTGEAHSTTVKAVNDSIILKIPKDDFAKILKRVPQLAIHLGQTLSRRLKRKDLHEKRIFESTIITVFGVSDKVGSTSYALNLGVSLKAQTNKRIILLDISKTGEDISTILGIKVKNKPLFLDSPFFDEDTIKASISKCPIGIDIINIPHIPDDTKDITHIIPLLSYLTNDYHYVIVDLPSYMDKTTFEALKQSDLIHLITAADEPSLHLTGKIVSELEKASPDIGGKIKAITSEYGIMKMINYANRRDVLKHDIYATLPVITADPDCEYSKAIRRISREVGECLIGLALGCGAAIGLAHIGILKVIEKERIPIDIVAGTSMGALIGALWASGKSASDIEEILALFEKTTKTLNLADLTFPKKGLIKGNQVRKFLRSQLGDMTFYDLKLPFKAVSCDIEKREEVVLDKGSLVDAIMASVAIPGVFEPVEIDDRLLVDGGIINPLPTNVLIRNGVTKIIASNALPSPEDIQKSKKRTSNIFDFIVNSIQASEYLLAEMSCQSADIAMHPVLPTVDWYGFYEGAKVIRRGEEEAMKYLAEMKELAAS